MAQGKVRRPSHRIGDEVVLASFKSVIPPYDGKPFVGREDVLRVSGVTGTGSKRNPYGVIVTDGTYFWHLEPDDVVSTNPVSAPTAHGHKPARAQHATKKSAVQLGREIANMLEGVPSSMTSEQVEGYRSGRRWGWPADLAYKVATGRTLSRTPRRR